MPAVVLAAVLLVTVAHAGEPAPLGLTDAVRLALARQPVLDAQAAAVDAAAATAVAAGQWPDPKLRVGLASLPLDTYSFTQEAMTQFTVAVSQTVPVAGKARLAGARGERASELARAQLEAVRRRVARDAALAWLAAWWPEASLDLVRRIGREWDGQLAWADVAYQTDKLAQDEVVAMRGQAQVNGDRQDDLARQARRGRAELARWLGEATAAPLADPADVPALPAPAELAARLDDHPELAALAGAVAVARAEVDLARAAYKPDLTFDVGYGLRGAERPDLISFGVAMDLPVFTANRQDRRLAAAEARVTQAEQTLADRRLGLRAELDAALADWQAAHRRIARFDQEILPLASQRVTSALNAYASDRATFGRVAEARRAELEARLGRLGQRVALARAQVQIDYLTQEVQP
ncbi:TolC family protein [Parasulfuritortus cantonensis]|uniref:TolC family protein n=1 Tax=Parasulfuritortus cantonensis TaxID=2528202 RepID=UPI001404301C|nr:TolC family protein [Parasulfuritortus cantonensis]